MELKDTVALMLDSDYKKRFIAEYWQVKIRLERLEKLILEFEAGTSKFTPTCPIYMFKIQVIHMRGYLETLESRAELEQITLDDSNIAKARYNGYKVNTSI